PALTPLTAQPPVHADLAGVSLEVTVRAPGTRPRFEATGGFLFTHRGYSGPVVLDASHLAVRSRMAGGRQELTVQWTAEDRETWEALLRGTQRVTGIPVSKGAIGTPAIQRSTGTFATAATVTALLRRRLPTRLADRLVQEAGVAPACPLSQLTKVGRTALVRLLTEYPLPWSGDEGYKKAEVTGGGVALSEVHPGSLESRLHPGLFLCGEILDAFGPIGGHNFLWAWATGRAAGLGAARSVLAESSDGI
ncbi:MAG: NAD(P)/FAD-dependent oxidoreductase, partial [Gemmatimonadota bacterium]|nr:NAD(P)/FAD-dependent oxidoreductase [Gemmatimonadota bacterium]